MINAELLYKLKQSGGTYKELGVHHLPRLAGRATGASLRVIFRAFRELFIYAYRWRLEEQQNVHDVVGADDKRNLTTGENMHNNKNILHAGVQKIGAPGDKT
jgi:hypothetical protein